MTGISFSLYHPFSPFATSLWLRHSSETTFGYGTYSWYVSLSLVPYTNLYTQALHVVLLIFLLLFTVLTTEDLLMMVYHLSAAGTILVYLLPAAILSWRNRESGYEKGWVEMLYITYQVLWSWGKSENDFDGVNKTS